MGSSCRALTSSAVCSRLRLVHTCTPVQAHASSPLSINVAPSMMGYQLPEKLLPINSVSKVQSSRGSLLLRLQAGRLLTLQD